MLHKHIDPEAHIDVLVRGIAASPGAAVGKAVFDTNMAAELGKLGESVILVRQRNCSRRYPRHDRKPRSADPEGWQDLPCSRRSERDGQACRGRSRNFGDPRKSSQAGDVIINEGGILTIDGGTGDALGPVFFFFFLKGAKCSRMLWCTVNCACCIGVPLLDLFEAGDGAFDGVEIGQV